MTSYVTRRLNIQESRLLIPDAGCSFVGIMHLPSFFVVLGKSDVSDYHVSHTGSPFANPTLVRHACGTAAECVKNEETGRTYA